MNKLFALLLGLLLPIQFALAAAAACVNAVPMPHGDVEHHHAHHHQSATDNDNAGTPLPEQADHCQDCHAACCSPLPAVAHEFIAANVDESPAGRPQRFSPPPPSARPERPKWPGFA